MYIVVLIFLIDYPTHYMRSFHIQLQYLLCHMEREQQTMRRERCYTASMVGSRREGTRHLCDWPAGARFHRQSNVYEHKYLTMGVSIINYIKIVYIGNKSVSCLHQIDKILIQWVSFIRAKLLKNLHDDDGRDYEVLQTIRMSTILLVIIVRKKLRKHILHCCSASLPRGFINKFGNKGGVGVSLKLNEANICFINSHLAAHWDKLADRNDDYRAIEECLRFEEEGKPSRTISNHE